MGDAAGPAARLGARGEGYQLRDPPKISVRTDQPAQMRAAPWSARARGVSCASRIPSYPSPSRLSWAEDEDKADGSLSCPSSQGPIRRNAYQVLHLSIADALDLRSPNVASVMAYTLSVTLASILNYVRERRCHHFVVVEPEDVPARDADSRRGERAAWPAS